MKKRMHIFALAAVAAAVLMACGGGPGRNEPHVPYLPQANNNNYTSTSSTAGSGGTTGGSSSTTQAEKLPTMTLSVVTDSGTPGNVLTGNQLSRAKVVVKDENGAPAAGVLVQFAGHSIGAGMLEFIPQVATAITNDKGEAAIDVKAKDAATLNGGTAIVAKVVLAADPKYTAISEAVVPVTVKAGASTDPAGQPVDPHTLVEFINFIEADPADESIVIQGTGGLGRTEAAQLVFRVLDANRTPVEGAVVKFALKEEGPATGVTLHATQVKTGADGKAAVTVTSGTEVTTVLVQATVEKKAANGSVVKVLKAPSSRITVSNGAATQEGFDLSADKFNLNFDETGDKATIVVNMADKNGNTVPDGTAVTFTADAGRVGSAAGGKCETQNGACEVSYIVQNPRPLENDPSKNKFKGIAIVTATASGGTIKDSLIFTMTSVSWLGLYQNGQKMSVPQGSVPAVVVPVKCGLDSVFLKLHTDNTNDKLPLPAPANTTVTMTARSKDVKITVGGVPTPTSAALLKGTQLTLGIDSEKFEFCEAGSGSSTLDVDTTYSVNGVGSNKFSHSEVVRLQFQR